MPASGARSAVASSSSVLERLLRGSRPGAAALCYARLAHGEAGEIGPAAPAAPALQPACDCASDRHPE